MLISSSEICPFGGNVRYRAESLQPPGVNFWARPRLDQPAVAPSWKSARIGMWAICVAIEAPGGSLEITARVQTAQSPSTRGARIHQRVEDARDALMGASLESS